MVLRPGFHFLDVRFDSSATLSFIALATGGEALSTSPQH